LRPADEKEFETLVELLPHMPQALRVEMIEGAPADWRPQKRTDPRVVEVIEEWRPLIISKFASAPAVRIAHA
jgi:hypothetical protein